MPDAEINSARYRALIQLLRTAEDLWNASRVFFARWNLSPSQFNVLNVLHDQPHGLSQSELSRLLIMHRSNVTGLVDRLQRRGLVRRDEHPSDRRAYRVVLASAGRELLEGIHPDYFAAADRVWAAVPAPRVEELLRELEDLADNAAAVAAMMGAHGKPLKAPLPLVRRSKTRQARPRATRSKPPAPDGGSARAEDVLRISDL